MCVLRRPCCSCKWCNPTVLLLADRSCRDPNASKPASSISSNTDSDPGPDPDSEPLPEPELLTDRSSALISLPSPPTVHIPPFRHGLMAHRSAALGDAVGLMVRLSTVGSTVGCADGASVVGCALGSAVGGLVQTTPPHVFLALSQLQQLSTSHAA